MHAARGAACNRSPPGGAPRPALPPRGPTVRPLHQIAAARRNGADCAAQELTPRRRPPQAPPPGPPGGGGGDPRPSAAHIVSLPMVSPQTIAGHHPERRHALQYCGTSPRCVVMGGACSSFCYPQSSGDKPAAADARGDSAGGCGRCRGKRSSCLRRCQHLTGSAAAGPTHRPQPPAEDRALTPPRPPSTPPPSQQPEETHERLQNPEQQLTVQEKREMFSNSKTVRFFGCGRKREVERVPSCTDSSTTSTPSVFSSSEGESTPTTETTVTAVKRPPSPHLRRFFSTRHQPPDTSAGQSTGAIPRDSASSGRTPSPASPLHSTQGVSGRASGQGRSPRRDKPRHERPRGRLLPQPRPKPPPPPPDDTIAEENVFRMRNFTIDRNRRLINIGDTILDHRLSPISSNRSSPCRSGPGSPRSPARAHRRDVVEEEEEEQGAVAACYHVSVVGSGGVGKTTLLNQMQSSEFSQTDSLSIEEESETTVDLTLGNVASRMVFEEKQGADYSILKNSRDCPPDAIVVVYSIIDQHSFYTANKIVTFLKLNGYTGQNPVLLVANKADLARSRVVPQHDGRQLATSRGCKYIETSACLQHNVDELLVGALLQIHLRQEQRARSAARVTEPSSPLLRTLRATRQMLSRLRDYAERTSSCEDLFTL